MQGKTIAIGAVLAFVAFSAIVFVLYQQQQSQPLEQDYEKEFSDLGFVEEELTPVAGGSILQGCGALQTQAEKDICLALEAGNEQNAEKCLLISEKPAQIDCIRAVAVDFESDSTKEEMALCDEIPVEDYAAYLDCANPLLPQMTQEKLSVCNKYFAENETQKYLCHSTIARNLGDFAICDPMPENFKQGCTTMVQSEA